MIRPEHRPGARAGSVARVVAMLLLSSLLVACTAGRSDGTAATTPVDADRASRQQAHRQQVAAITDFEVGGGFGFWTDEQQLTTRLTWAQHGENLDIDVIAPMAAGSLAVSRQDGLSTIRRGTESLSSREPLDTLLQQALGLDVRVPVSQLSDWLRGLPGEGRDLEYDTAGRLVALQLRDEAGRLWRARFRRYASIDGIELPALITAVSKPYHVRLVLKRWQLGEPPGEGAGEGEEVAPEPGAPVETPSPSRLRIPGRRA